MPVPAGTQRDPWLHILPLRNTLQDRDIWIRSVGNRPAVAAHDRLGMPRGPDDERRATLTALERADRDRFRAVGLAEVAQRELFERHHPADEERRRIVRVVDRGDRGARAAYDHEPRALPLPRLERNPSFSSPISSVGDGGGIEPRVPPSDARAEPNCCGRWKRDPVWHAFVDRVAQLSIGEPAGAAAFEEQVPFTPRSALVLVSDAANNREGASFESAGGIELNRRGIGWWIADCPHAFEVHIMPDNDRSAVGAYGLNGSGPEAAQWAAAVWTICRGAAHVAPAEVVRISGVGRLPYARSMRRTRTSRASTMLRTIRSGCHSERATQQNTLRHRLACSGNV